MTDCTVWRTNPCNKSSKGKPPSLLEMKSWNYLPHIAWEACGSLGTFTLSFIAPICALHGFLSFLYSFGGKPTFVLLCLKHCSNCSNTVFSFVAVLCFLVSALGITAGSHRLWSHRSYKATLPLRIFLTIANSMAFQVSTGPQKEVLPWIPVSEMGHNLMKRFLCPITSC